MPAAENLLDSITQAVIATDLEGKVVFWNRAAEDLYGEKYASVIGKPLRDVVHANSPLAEPASLFKEVRAGRSWSGAGRTNGSGLNLFTASASRDETGKLDGFVIVSTPLNGLDLSQALDESERSGQRESQLRQAQQTARIASWGWHIASDAIEGSADLLEVLNLDPEGALTLAEIVTNSVHPEDRDRIAAACERTRANDVPLDVEFRFRTPNGGERMLHLSGQRVVDSRGIAVRITGVVQDVTERRRLENRLLQAERVSSLGRLAASVAHEFNNVLMGIQPFIDLLTKRTGSDPTVKMAAPRIADAVARGKRITQEILRFTRIAEPSRAAVGIAGWLRAFEPELKQLAGPKVTVTMESEPSLAMLADAHQLRQVFVNLVANAGHAMPDGGKLDIRAIAGTLQDSNEHPVDAVHFTITDTGIGMSQETLRYIFEPLFTTKKLGGTGLGLAVASQVVQQHEGHIYAESAVGEGTTFHILIPAADAPPEVVAPPPRAYRPHPGMRLTLIEDEESVGTGLVAVLNYEGIFVDWVRLGAEAVDRIAAQLPDAVILDLGLPDINGLKVYKEIAALWPDLPVLISTGGDEKVDALRGKNVGYLQKPYESDVLLAALDELLG